MNSSQREYEISVRDRAEERDRILSSPENVNKIKALAGELVGTFEAHAKALIDFRPGGIFEDNLTKSRYIYEGGCVPFEHNVASEIVFEMAHDPLEILRDSAYFFFRTAGLDVGQRFVIAAADFVKYFAVGRWIILERNLEDQGGYDEYFDKGANQ